MSSYNWVTLVKQRNDFLMVEFQSSVTGIAEIFYTELWGVSEASKELMGCRPLSGIFEARE